MQITAPTTSMPARPAGPLDSRLTDRLLSQITLAGGSLDRIPVVAPYTGATLAEIPAGRAVDVQLAMDRARTAQPGWAALPFTERGGVFLRFHDLLLERQDEILDLIQLENGKARIHALEEVLDTAAACRYYARRAEWLLRPRRRKGAFPWLTRTCEFRSPVGVVGFVVPWNYPLNVPVTDAAPALMAGNTVILKPDHRASLTALWAVDLLREVGLPREALQVVTGDGAVIGPEVVERADYVMFTGSTRTGKQVAAQAAKRLAGCSLELGGKNPMLVLADADLEAAADGAVRGCFAGAGQVCISIERIYVHQSVYERFTKRFAERTRALKLGAALDYSMDMGSLTSEQQLGKVEEHVRDALAKGATLLAGGRRRPDLGPLFYEPTVLAGVSEHMRVFAEETFGPVVAVYPFVTDDEAVERANATEYGLNASVWSRNISKAVRIAQRIRAGSVNVNEAYAAAWGSVDAPVGGMKQSGLGRRHGREGIFKFTETQTVAVQRWLPLAPSHGISGAGYARLLTGLLKLLRRLGPLG